MSNPATYDDPTYDENDEQDAPDFEGVIGPDGERYCCVHHAWQAQEQREREERKRRDREDLRAVWREEVRRRRRERFFKRSWIKQDRRRDEED